MSGHLSPWNTDHRAKGPSFFRFHSWIRAVFRLSFCFLPSAVLAQHEPYEAEPYAYSATVPSGRMETLKRDAASGLWNPPTDDPAAFLADLLKKLGISVHSQTLVFSKTSQQNDLIRPGNPRALYFDERTYIGWVPGGMVEIADMDPRLGAVFYTAHVRPGEKAAIVRDNSCLSCHATTRTSNFPGVVARSVIVDSTGEVMVSSSDGANVTDETPFSARWGGWHVTGDHGKARHRGNLFGPAGVRRPELNFDAGANWKTVAESVPAGVYPVLTSDISALMVMEHQIGMHQRITEAQYTVGLALRRYQGIQDEFGSDFGVETVKTIIAHQRDSLLEGLLFQREAPMPEGGARGAPEFEAAFLEQGIRDAKGRSLREFHHFHRLFKYRCSFLIHSDSFLALPVELKAAVYAGLFRALAGGEIPGDGRGLGELERAAIREILSETHAEFRTAEQVMAAGGNELGVLEALRPGADPLR